MGTIVGDSKYGTAYGSFPLASQTLPHGMTSMSRTSYNQFFPAGFAQTFAAENREAAEKLRSVEERIKRGHDNSLVQLALVSQRAREAAKHVPCIDELRKRSEDKAQSTWEKFLVKHHGLMKKQQQLEKAQKEEERARTQKHEEHLSLIKQKIRFNALE